jgi:N-acetylneuraminate synthase
MKQRCLVIAEAGVNHNGSVELAHRMVDVAADAGADFVKFQTFRAAALVTQEAPKADYQKRESGVAESQYEMLKRLELPKAAFAELAAYCRSRRIGFLSTPFDAESAAFLDTLEMPVFKVSSGDLTNTPFLRILAGFGRPIILSSGMATLAELEQGVEVLEASRLPIEMITLLHCTTDYPAPPAEVNLRAMHTLRTAFPGATIGYSDHTVGIDIPVAAVALGAQVIEKHFTLDRSQPGPDHSASLEPKELREMVASVRRIELALGDGRKRPTASELPNRAVARKSVVAISPIQKGELFSCQNLAARRPGTGLPPIYLEALIGQSATRDYQRDEVLEFRLTPP